IVAIKRKISVRIGVDENVKPVGADFAANFHLVIAARYSQHVVQVPCIVIALLGTERRSSNRRISGYGSSRPTEANRIWEEGTLNSCDSKLFGPVVQIRLIENASIQPVESDTCFIHDARS